jgi:hypothetical protein
MRRVTSTNRDHRRRSRLFGLITATVTIMAVTTVTVVGTGTGQALAGGRPADKNASLFAAMIRESGGATDVRNQDALSQFRAWMFKQPGFATSGYVGTIDNLAHKGMTVMWYGPSTPLLKSIMAEGARRGITIGVQHRTYSLQQLKTAAQSVFQQAAAGKWAGFKVSAVEALSATNGGITIDGTYTSAPSTERALQVRSLATEVDGVPATVVPGRPATPASGRDADFSPFNSGGYMVSNTSAGGTTEGNTCSSGFSIAMNGSTYTITARHCAFLNGGSTHYADYVARSFYQEDAPSINHYGNPNGSFGTFSSLGGAALLTGAGSGLAFIDSVGSTTTLPVVQLSDLGVNDLVCTDGGNSGEHCNVKVTNLLVQFNDTDGTFETIEGLQETAGQIAVIQGDSGGPVVVNVASGEVGAAGMIQGFLGAGMTGSACAPAYDLGSNKCSTNVEFTSMRGIVQDVTGGSLVTS